MKSKLFPITTLILGFGLIVTVYFIVDYSNQNKELTTENGQLTSSLSDTEAQLDKSEGIVDSLEDEYSSLTFELEDQTASLEELQLNHDELLSSHDELQSNYDELFNFTYCGEELIDLVEMNYRSNAKASEALTLWVDDMWGDVLTSWWWDFWSPDAPALHVIETGYANDYFIVYFEQQEFKDANNGVFIVSHYCWLDGGPGNH